MAYVNYEYYKSLYGDKALDETTFNRLSWDAEREMNRATSGIDGVKKLKVAFPTEEEAAEAVKRCVCALVEFLSQLELAQKGATFSQNADGTVHGNMVSSVSAGNESISYATSETTLGTAIKSTKDRDATVYELISSRLSGVADANGVNLLFGGRYPYRLEE